MGKHYEQVTVNNERLTRLNVAEFQRFCDAVDERAQAAGLSEEQVAAA